MWERSKVGTGRRREEEKGRRGVNAKQDLSLLSFFEDFFLTILNAENELILRLRGV